MVGSLPVAPCFVVVPIKRFANAKTRLAGVLSARERELLARSMAERVIAAAAGMPLIVVTDDDEVARWAAAHGASVLRDSNGGGLNGAVRSGVEAARSANAERVIVIHADIPLATSLARFASVPSHHAVLVPDARYDGTNVLSIPTDSDLEFAYGPGSFARHHRALLRSGFNVVVAPDRHLAADVDHPSDLHTARAAGLWPLVG